jgi:ribosomal protein S18 acetylase RimI-like enzyme
MYLQDIETIDLHFVKEMLFEALYVREGEAPFSRSIIEEPNLKKYYENWGRTGDIGVLAMVYGGPYQSYIQDFPVGAAWSRLFTKENPSYGFIDENTPEITIAAKKEYQSKGIGQKLMNKLIEANQKAGFQQLSLSVDTQSSVKNWYLKLGFEIIKTEGTAHTMLLKL